jgi:soluble lytic murein transglycosylase-like protein
MARATLLLLIGLVCSSQTQAMYHCTDEWGRAYLLPLPVTVGVIKFTCRQQAEVQSQTRSAEPETEIRAAADALGFQAPTTAKTSRHSGSLAMVVDATPMRVRREPGASPFSPPPRSKVKESMDRMIAGVAQQYGHDVNLLKAIIHVESRFNPNALSPKGAIGLMQVMPATGSRVGVNQPKQALFDPEMNVQAGARYLRILLDMFSDQPELAIAAYNAGEGAVMRYRRTIPPYPETQSYVRQVLARYRYYQSL